MLILGIDDAGRGPILGPMYLAGVLVDDSKEAEYKEAGVADSKLISHPKRVILADMIKDTALAFSVAESTPQEIDRAVESINLNTLEAQKAGHIINETTKKYTDKKIKVIVDCPSTNLQAWRLTLLKYVHDNPNLDIYCEHKADFKYPVVGAASILAKVAREEAVEQMKADFEHLGDLGSGYPSDPITKAFLKKHHAEIKDSGIVRKSWATWKDLFHTKKQATLDGF